MKLRDLRTMGSLESRMYRSLFNLVELGVPGKWNGFGWNDKGSYKDLCCEIADLELQDILDLYSEKEIMRSRGFGAKCMARLKELV